jgi:hypothetical protein
LVKESIYILTSFYHFDIVAKLTAPRETWGFFVIETMAEVKNETQTVAIPATAVMVTGAVISFMEKIKGLFLSVLAGGVAGSTGTKTSPIAKLPRIRFNKKNIMRVILPILLFVVAIGGIYTMFNRQTNVQGVNTVATSTNKILATVPVNREFSFPLKDAKEKEIGRFTYIIESAELRNQIVVKGQTATAVDGRVFLLLNLKLVNGLDQGLSINTRDYIRVSINGDEKEWFAPDIHNDPVETQAISTKSTRVGIAIDEDDRDIKLQIGEINGTKEIIPVSF